MDAQEQDGDGVEGDGKAGGSGGERRGNETVMVVDSVEFTTGSW